MRAGPLGAQLLAAESLLWGREEDGAAEVVHAKRRAKSTNAGSDLIPLMLLEKTDNCGP
jgi:hypothetical protein